MSTGDFYPPGQPYTSDQSFIADLKQRVLNAEENLSVAESKLDSFFSGNVPNNASLDHIILAKWGRKRKEEMRTTPKLLSGNSEG